MDTTANSLTRILHVLAEHPAEQEMLRAEVNDARHGNDIAYEALEKLPYLDSVCRETLRLYSPVNVIGRTCVCVSSSAATWNSRLYADLPRT